MSIHEIRQLLIWCTIINYGILLLWFLMFTCIGNWFYRFQNRWFPLSRETFTVVHYCGIGLYKLAIFIFNLIPLIALLILG